MQIDVSTVLKGIDGEPLPLEQQNPALPPDPDAKKMTLGDILAFVLLAPPAHGKTYSQHQQVARYDLAITIHKARTLAEFGAVVEIDATMAADLKSDIARMYAPIIAGQVLPILDGR